MSAPSSYKLEFRYTTLEVSGRREETTVVDKEDGGTIYKDDCVVTLVTRSADKHSPYPPISVDLSREDIFNLKVMFEELLNVPPTFYKLKKVYIRGDHTTKK